jgi:hypothetical protein
MKSVDMNRILIMFTLLKPYKKCQLQVNLSIFIMMRQTYFVLTLKYYDIYNHITFYIT